MTQTEVGVVKSPNSGAANAEQPFLYALVQLHNFEYDHAAAAFRKAKEIDVNLVLAFLGEPMCKNYLT